MRSEIRCSSCLLRKSPAIFDPLKLRAINAEYIRRLSPEEFQKKAEPWIDSAVHSAIDKKLLELAGSVTEDEEGTIVLIRKNGEETIAMIFNCSSSAKKFNEYTQKYNLLTENTFDGNVEGFDAAVIVL